MRCGVGGQALGQAEGVGEPTGRIDRHDDHPPAAARRLDARSPPPPSSCRRRPTRSTPPPTPRRRRAPATVAQRGTPSTSRREQTSRERGHAVAIEPADLGSAARAAAAAPARRSTARSRPSGRRGALAGEQRRRRRRRHRALRPRRRRRRRGQPARSSTVVARRPAPRRTPTRSSRANAVSIDLVHRGGLGAASPARPGTVRRRGASPAPRRPAPAPDRCDGGVQARRRGQHRDGVPGGRAVDHDRRPTRRCVRAA